MNMNTEYICNYSRFVSSTKYRFGKETSLWKESCASEMVIVFKESYIKIWHISYFYQFNRVSIKQYTNVLIAGDFLGPWIVWQIQLKRSLGCLFFVWVVPSAGASFGKPIHPSLGYRQNWQNWQNYLLDCLISEKVQYFQLIKTYFYCLGSCDCEQRWEEGSIMKTLLDYINGWTAGYAA